MEPQISTLKSQLLDHLQQENEAGLKNIFENNHPSDLAEALEILSRERARKIFQVCPSEQRSEILGQLTPVLGRYVLSGLSDREVIHALSELNPDDSADIFLAFSKKRQQQLLPLIEEGEFRQELVDLISYPPDSAGGIMTTEYLAVPETFTVEETLAEIQKEADEAEVIYYVFTINEGRRLSGAVSMRRLLEADGDIQIREIAQRDLFKVRLSDDQEKAAKIMDRYGLLAVPVVDHQDRMRGIITSDDAVGILERETTEDIFKQAGLSPYEELESERSMRLTHASLWSNMTLRIPWLVIVSFGTLLTASSVSMFEEYLTKYVELAFFMPVIAAMGGNVGAQSTTIFVRGLVLGHVDMKHFWKQFFMEIFRTGFGIGLFFGGFFGLCTWLWQFFIRSASPDYALFFSLAVGVSMFLAIVAASALGFLIPYTVYKVGADPATASNPLLTTLQDVVGLLIYFSCAIFFLSFL